MPRRRHARTYRHAVSLALIAMLLLVTGPVIGQLSAFDDLGHHLHSDASRSAMTSATTSAQHPPLSEAIGWHAQCGYCSLFQHFPVLPGALTPAARLALWAAGQPLASPQAAHGHLAVFPNALSRAPPAIFR
ncbi:DUF2946 domain-containing protein [Modicisalibacter luteus]|uniref:DUF2946 domain-containing protein n=1 Tax=Modicisalibacter luteus TaxID=453962 RepID=A0ABV7LZ03_9GAMM|nr:DUF2946 domain-containing protein [Halomonas lutea]